MLVKSNHKGVWNNDMKVIDDERIILKMVDGGLVGYSDSTRHTLGCPTCNYGSQYINDIDIDLKRHSVHIEINQMYDYALSEGKMMILLLSNCEQIMKMTEKQFIEWMRKQIIEIVKNGYDGMDAFRVFDVTEKM